MTGPPVPQAAPQGGAGGPRTTPPAPRVPWPGLFGLRVDLGVRDRRSGRWIRPPAADLTCRWGCTAAASGPEAVARFCGQAAAEHARHCPGPPRHHPT